MTTSVLAALEDKPTVSFQVASKTDRDLARVVQAGQTGGHPLPHPLRTTIKSVTNESTVATDHARLRFGRYSASHLSVIRGDPQNGSNGKVPRGPRT